MNWDWWHWHLGGGKKKFRNLSAEEKKQKLLADVRKAKKDAARD